MATLREYFTRDFAGLLSVQVDQTTSAARVGNVVSYPVRIHYDFDSCAMFVSIYLPPGVDPVAVTKFYADDISQALTIADSVETGMKTCGSDTWTYSTDLVFTGRLFVYSEEDVPSDASAELREYCSTREIKLVIRDSTYRDDRNQYEHPEAFISHDSRDKKDVAEPIAVGLQKLLCPVWYDEFSLKVGDSLRESFESGIKEAKKCIVVLSTHFFSNNGWTKAEFDSIYMREIIEKRHIILPVWHGVSKQEVYEYSPALANRWGVSTALGMDEVVRRLLVAIRSRSTEAAV